MTRQRIRDWIDYFGEDGVYISFSGGKDSTVLLDIVRNVCGYKDCKAMFVDVPTQYPELRDFAKRFDNVDIVRPKMNFMQVCEKYGFPLISKEVSENVYGAKKYLRTILDSNTIVQTDRQTDRQTYRIGTVWIDSAELASTLNERMLNREGGSNQRLAIMLGMLTRNPQHPVMATIPKDDRSKFAMTKYKFMLDAPFEISNVCCRIMKKNPAHDYEKATGRKPMTAQMAVESRLRKQKWIQHGCNAFESGHQVSNPMAFWTENDVLQYIAENNLEICSVYGDVVTDSDQNVIPGCGIPVKYKTTGCTRTGCMLCGFGCQFESLEKGNARFLNLKETHPGMYGMLDKCTNNGVTFRQAIEWINENGTIKIPI